MPSSKDDAVAPPELSARQLEVVALLAQGLEYKEIAEQLSVSYYSVRTHAARCREKLDLRNQTQLAAWYKDHYEDS